MSDAKTDHSKTVLLPQTAFPMKAGLAESEPRRVEAWEKQGAYQKLRALRKGRKRWILHDGPPFANGDIHMGTALNKILKDICVRFHNMKGFDAPFVPGWDCHGMPIEYKVAKALGAEKNKKSAIEVRRLCAAEAATFLDRQRQQFKRLGVWGEWGDPYVTMSPAYESAQLDAYWALLKAGQIYRGMKPVHWCVHDQTALAEAELEYKEHVSPAVTVKFPMDPGSIAPGRKLFALIWTTTPWTLPANLAITANERFDYGAYEVEGEAWLLAQALAGPLFEKLKLQPKLVWQGKGSELEALHARHPFIDRQVRFCLAPYVTLEAGTGLVHTAPGHGAEDYVTGQRYKLDTFCPVDAQGRYTDAFAPMQGKRVTDPETNAAVIEALKARGALVLEERLDHSYPHCWRCKNPIIFRATQQWFMSLDNNALRERVLAETEKVAWHTPGGAERFANMMKDRADWCISRQRVWGVPIYMFYCAKCGDPYFDEECYEVLKPIVEQEGGDAWFDGGRDAFDFMPSEVQCKRCGSMEFTRERDTLDVWFDSGSSSLAVLQARPDQEFPADLYLEGSDQYRGWFQSSMLVSVGVNSAAPYRGVLSCGWVLDAKGHAMHKSAGNVISPLDLMKNYGADVIRMWAASEDFTKDLSVGEEILKGVADNYRRLRNSFRWLLGNLNGFEPSRAVPPAKMEALDRWLLAELSRLSDDCGKAMAEFQFQRAYARLTGFCASQLSSFVFDAHKDTLYTLAASDPRRLSAQSALYEALHVLLRLCAPILAFTAEEAWEHMPASWKGGLESVHHAEWPEARPQWRDADLESDFEALLDGLMPVVKKKLEEARAAKRIGHPYDAKVILKLHSKRLKKALDRHLALLPSLFIVSEVEYQPAAPRDGLQVEPQEVEVLASPHRKCARCWRRPGDVKEEGGICGRCSSTTTA